MTNIRLFLTSRMRCCLCARFFASTLALVLTFPAHATESAVDAIDTAGRKEIAKYEQFVARHPKDVAALVKLGDLLYAYHRSGEAATRWKQALKLDDTLAKCGARQSCGDLS